MRSRSGFTLLEFLIAAAIFALISVAAFGLLSQIQTSDDISRSAGDQLHRLQRTMTILERDSMQMVQRQVRLGEETPTNQWLRADEGMLESEAMGIAFMRTGWRNPQARLPRAEVQGVGYRLREGKLERLTTLYPDVAANSEPRVTTLMEGLRGFKLRFWTSGKWQEQWLDDGLPQALEVTLDSEDFGLVTRLILLPEALGAGTIGGGPSGDGDGQGGSPQENSSGSGDSRAAGGQQGGSQSSGDNVDDSGGDFGQ
ncbi:MAG: type II secretion system minor pseudopilin GspJ [Gammaproteobacteria bacterium]|nr:type II secretion system minor pseudopilin GspJ [Gammaproteobacteria bacterium]